MRWELANFFCKIKEKTRKKFENFAFKNLNSLLEYSCLGDFPAGYPFILKVHQFGHKPKVHLTH